LHSQTAKQKFFSSTIKTLPNWPQNYGYKTSFHKCQNVESSQNIFSDHKAINLEINNKEYKTPNLIKLKYISK
jgi:hypothetical protein